MLSYYKYKIPFRSAFVSSTSSITGRSGFILVFEHDGVTAFGEVAPLPGFSNFSLPEIAIILTRYKKDIEAALKHGNTQDFLHSISNSHPISSLIFGLNTLFADYESKKNKQSLHTFLTGEPAKSVSSNAVLGMQSVNQTLHNSQNLIDEGFKTLKLKVGVNFPQELEILKAIRTQFPLVKIRLDANQAWTVKEAIKSLNLLNEIGIEYCEQPIPKDDFKGLAEVRKNTNVKIAADESFRSYEDAEKLLALEAVDILIMKPMLYGSFSNIYVTKRLAESLGVDLVFTTSIDHIVGRTATAILASVWGSNKYAHGLATGSFFEPDLYSTNEVENGNFILNNSWGLGLTVSYNNLTEFN
ncbi:MAG: o-succinylbenzoate synthase [Balneolaceae bacterium]